MIRHSVNVAITAVLGVVAFLGFWWMIADLLLRTMPQLLHSSGETALDAFVILMMVTAILTGRSLPSRPISVMRRRASITSGSSVRICITDARPHRALVHLLSGRLLLPQRPSYRSSSSTPVHFPEILLRRMLRKIGKVYVHFVLFITCRRNSIS